MKNVTGKNHYAVQDPPPPADISFVTRKFLNISYANLSPSQMLDIYLPDYEDELFPVIMQFHGGAFMGCDKSDMQVLPALQGLKRGYAVVAVNYRMSGEAKFPALVNDAKAAVRWVRANAENYKLDPKRIAAWGGSAGGYLSSMLGVSASVPELEDFSLGNSEQPCTILTVVDWYGPTNFLKMDAQLAENGLLAPEGMRHNDSNSPESLILGRKITSIPHKVAAANPETYISENAAPFFIQHGTKDANVPVQQSIEFAEKLTRAIGANKVHLELIKDAEHADTRFETTENVDKVLDFLDGFLQ